MSYGSSYVCSVDLVIRLADFESDRNREITGLDGGDEPPFATFHEPSHDIDVVGGKSGHGGNFAVGVSALAHPEDVLQQVHGLMLARSEEHSSELQSLLRISYAVFCLNKIRIFSE